LVPLAVILDHTVTLDRFVPWLRHNVPYTSAVIKSAHGHFYSQYPIGGSLLAAPLYAPLAFVPTIRNADPGTLVVFARIAEKIAASVIAALSAVLLLLLLQRITSPGWAWSLTLVYAVGTSTWSISSQALWQHGPGEFAIVGAFLCLAYWTENHASAEALWICGLAVACALIFRPTNIVLLPALFAALIAARATLAEHTRLWTLPLLGGLAIASYNLYVFGHLAGGHTARGFSAPFFAGLAGVLLSPGRGLLIYTPVALFAICAFVPTARSARHKYAPLFIACVVFVALDLLLAAKWRVWWGGYCWGPRLLTELAPSLLILIAMAVPALDRPWPRRAFAAVALYSMLTQGLGVFFYPKGNWDLGPPNVNVAPTRLWDWRDNPIRRTIDGGPAWEPYAVVATAIRNGIPAARVRMRQLNANPYDQSSPADEPAPQKLP
jgi:hypothetical protein